MAHAKSTARDRAPLGPRDGQQWMLDDLIQESGKVSHFQSVWSSPASGHETGLLKSSRGCQQARGTRWVGRTYASLSGQWLGARTLRKVLGKIVRRDVGDDIFQAQRSAVRDQANKGATETHFGRGCGQSSLYVVYAAADHTPSPSPTGVARRPKSDHARCVHMIGSGKSPSASRSPFAKGGQGGFSLVTAHTGVPMRASY
jgi:hypothetical protein